MKIKDLIKRSDISAKLIRSVIHQLGGFESFKVSAPDIYNHGIDGGYRGFISNRDTTAFFKRNRKEIMDLVESQAQELGDSGSLEMISSFRGMADFSQTEIAKAIYTGRGECADQIRNCLAWYAAEEVCRAWMDMLEEIP